YAEAGAAYIMYNEIRYLPNMNKRPVNKEPAKVSRNLIFASGKTLNIVPNKTQIIINVKLVLIQSIIFEEMIGKISLIYVLNALIIPFNINEVIRRKPKPITIE